MALKREVSKIEEVEERFRDLYTQQGEKFVLQADLIEGIENIGGVTSALEKERQAHREAKKKLKELTDKYGDLDPDEAGEALKLKRGIEEKKLIDAGKVDELVEQRTKALKADYDKKLKAAEDRASMAEGKLSELLIDGAIKDTALSQEVGARASALMDITLRAKSVWQLKDGQPVAIGKDGNPIYGKDGAPIGMKEWMVGIRTEAPHLFAESSGGGAGGGGRSNGVTPPQKNRSKMTPAEKAAYIGEHGQDAYLSLPQ